MLREKTFGEEGIFQKEQDVKIIILSIVGVIIGLCVIFTEDWRMPIFIIMMGIIIGMIFWRPYIGVLFFILLVYFPPEHHGVGGARISLFVSILILIAWVMRGISLKKLNMQWYSQLIVLGILSLWMFVITQTAHISVAESWRGSVKFFKIFLFCFLLVSNIDTQKKLYVMLALNLFGITYFSLSGFYYFLTGGDVKGIGGMCGDNNGLAHLLVMFFPLAISLIFYPDKWIRLWGWALFPMQIATIALSNSRGGGVGLTIVIVWMIIQALMGFRWKMFGIMGVVVLLAIVVMVGTDVGKKYTKRVETIKVYNQDEGSAMKRIILWQAGLEMMKDYPITGVGLQNFKLTFPEYDSYSKPQTPHSTYIQFGSECGIPGLGLYLLLLFLHFKTLIAIKRIVSKNSFEAYLCMALGAGMLGHMVASIFLLKSYFEPVYWLILSGAILKKTVTQRNQ